MVRTRSFYRHTPHFPRISTRRDEPSSTPSLVPSLESVAIHLCRCVLTCGLLMTSSHALGTLYPAVKRAAEAAFVSAVEVTLSVGLVENVPGSVRHSSAVICPSLSPLPSVLRGAMCCGRGRGGPIYLLPSFLFRFLLHISFFPISFSSKKKQKTYDAC